MKLMEEADDNVTILEPCGRLDSTTAQEFGNRLLELVNAGRTAVVVDLKSISYISRAGLHAPLVAIGSRPKGRPI